MQENFEGNFDPDTDNFSELEKLCPTHWAVHPSCFQKIIDNYCLLLKLWDECLKESLDDETRFRIIGCKAQMKTFNFLFGLCVGQRHYSLTDNLSKTLQNEKMSASLTIKTIQSIINDPDFDLFYQLVSKKVEKIDDLNEAVLPRKQWQPNYSILQFVSSHEEKSDTVEPYYPTTAKEHFKAIYFETINVVHKALKERFEQPSFIIFSNVEPFLLKSINGENYQKEYDNFVSVFADDVETTALPNELVILHTMFESLEPVHFGDIVEKLKTISPQERVIVNNVITIIKIVLTTGATNASPERCFYLARQVKIWLRSSMTQKRFVALAILQWHKDIVNKLSLVAIDNDFVDNLPNWRNNLGTFSDSDLH